MHDLTTLSSQIVDLVRKQLSDLQIECNSATDSLSSTQQETQQDQLCNWENTQIGSHLAGLGFWFILHVHT
jgi:hypothetical protein